MRCRESNFLGGRGFCSAACSTAFWPDPGEPSMKTMTKILAATVAAALLGVAAPASAKLTDAEAARLGADLTPVGAEKAGN